MNVDEIKAKLIETQQRYLPVEMCYRITGDQGGHYRIIRFGADTNGEITAEVVHGRDSRLAGLAVFGVSLDHLVRCDCGKWKPPTRKQMREREKWLSCEVCQ